MGETMTMPQNFPMSIDEPIDDYAISDEPLYFGTALIFAFLTTTLSGILGLSWFLPLLQTITLAIFMLPLMRRGRVKRALALFASWLLIQFLVIMFLSMATPGQMEHAIADGFNRRTGMLAWFYASAEPPAGLVVGLGGRLLELLAVGVGSALTGGLVGFWFVVRGVNLAAFYSGTILAALSDTAIGIGAFPIWSLLRLVGYGLLTVIAAGPLLNRTQSLGLYFRQQRILLVWAIGLILFGLILELTLPDLWRTWFS